MRPKDGGEGGKRKLGPFWHQLLAWRPKAQHSEKGTRPIETTISIQSPSRSDFLHFVFLGFACGTLGIKQRVFFGCGGNGREDSFPLIKATASVNMLIMQWDFLVLKMA